MLEKVSYFCDGCHSEGGRRRLKWGAAFPQCPNCGELSILGESPGVKVVVVVIAPA